MAKKPVGLRRSGKLRQTPRDCPTNTTLSRAVHRDDPNAGGKFLDLIARHCVLAALKGGMAAEMQVSREAPRPGGGQ